MSQYTNSFAFPYKCLTIMGLWAIETQNPVAKAAYYIYQTWVIFFLLFFISGGFWDLYAVRNDVHRVSTNLSSTMTVFMLLWKNSQALFKYPDIRKLQKGLRRDVNEEKDDGTRRILLKTAREIKLTDMLIYTLGGGTITCWLFFVFFQKNPDGKRSLPLPIWVPWPHEESPYFEIAFLFQVYGGYIVAFDVLSVNLIIFGAIAQVCAEYDVLMMNTEKIKDWYVNLCRFSRPRALSKEENFIVGKMIAANIQHHQKIINVVDKAENCFVHMMLVQFGGLAILNTVVSLDLILISTAFDSRMLTLIVFLGLVSSDLYLYCSYGGRLINKSYEFLECVYGLPWEAMNSRNRKTVSIVILKAQRPPKLTVEKLADINLYTLLKITKIIYNILYLLLHLAKEK